MAFSRTGLSSTSQPAQAGPGRCFRPASSDGCTRSFVIQPHHLVRERSAAADAPPSGRDRFAAPPPGASGLLDDHEHHP